MLMIKAKYLLFQNVTYKNLNTHNFIINIHTSLSLKSKKEFKNQKVNQKKKKKNEVLATYYLCEPYIYLSTFYRGLH